MTEPEICETNLIVFLKAARVVQSNFSNFVAFPREDDVVAQSKIESVFEFVIFKFTSALVAF